VKTLQKKTAMLISTLLLAAIFAINAVPVAAAPVNTYVETLEYPTGYFWNNSGLEWFEPWYRFFDGDWGWNHTFDPTGKTIISANLTIWAWDIDVGEVNVIYADGTELGVLEGLDDVWTSTVLNIPNLGDLLDGMLEVEIDIDSTNDFQVWGCTLNNSTLSVDWVLTPELSVVVPETVPVCNDFTVTVAVSDVNELYQVYLNLSYDPSVMEWQEVELLLWGLPNGYSYEVFEGEGRFELFMWGVPSFNGTKDLVNLVFHCNGTGTSDLDLFDTQLVDPSGALIQHTVLNGTVTQESIPVGGDVVSVDLLQLVTPYILVVIAVVCTATVLYKKRYI
jgi:hypothetical protein